MMACPDIFWHYCSAGAGVRLGVMLPRLLGFGAVLWAIVRQQHRHEEAMQEARLRASQVRDAHDRVIQGGQG
jgi:hypothetical protein